MRTKTIWKHALCALAVFALTLCVCTALAEGVHGYLLAPDLNIPSALEAGQSLSFAVPEVVNAGEVTGYIGHFIALIDRTGDGWTYISEQTYSREELAGGARFTVSANDLEPGHIYMVNYYAYADGWRDADVNTTFVVITEHADDVVLYVNGVSEGEVSLLRNEEYHVEIHAPGASLVRLFTGSYYTYIPRFEWDEDMPDGVFETLVEAQESGTMPLFAQAYYGDDAGDYDYDTYDSMDWSGPLSNIVTLVVTANGIVEPAEFSVPETVARGELLEITVTQPSANAEWYEGNAYGTGFESHSGFYHQTGSTLYLPTSNLVPGEYQLQLSACATGYEDYWIEASFTVLDSEAEGMVFRVSRDEVEAGEVFVASCYAPGATETALYVKDLTYGGDPYLYYSEYGEGLYTSPDFDPGRYELFARALDGAGEVMEESEHIVVTVQKGSAQVEPIEIHGPGSLVVGEDYVFSVTGLDTALSWDIEVEDDYGRTIATFRDLRDSYTVDGSKFNAGNWYRVYVRAQDANYESKSIYFHFYACEGVDGGITVTVNGKTNADVLIGERYTVDYSAPGAKALLISNSSYWEFCWDFDPETGVGHRTFEQGEVGTVAHMARGYYGDKTAEEMRELGWNAEREPGWGEPSRAAFVNVSSLGTVGIPILEVPATVVRGEMLPVTVLSAEHATHLDFCIPMRIGPGQHENLEAPEYSGVEFPFTAYLPTAALDPAGEYCVMVWANGPGYEESEVNYDQYNFTVLEPSDEIILTLNRTTATTEDEVWASIVAPGAEAVRLNWIDVDSPDWPDSMTEYEEYLQRQLYINAPGVYEFTAEARYGGEWRQGETTVQLVLIDSGSLEPPVADYAQNILLGREGLDFSFNAVKNAEYYVLMVRDAVTFEEAGRMTMTAPGNYTLGGDVRLNAGRVYEAWLTACAEGKQDSAGAKHRFAVIDPDKMLSLPAGLNRIDEEAFEGIDAQLIVVPEGVTRIGADAFADSGVIAIVLPNSVTGIDPSIYEDDDILIVDSY